MIKITKRSESVTISSILAYQSIIKLLAKVEEVSGKLLKRAAV